MAEVEFPRPAGAVDHHPCAKRRSRAVLRGPRIKGAQHNGQGAPPNPRRLGSFQDAGIARKVRIRRNRGGRGGVVRPAVGADKVVAGGVRRRFKVHHGGGGRCDDQHARESRRISPPEERRIRVIVSLLTPFFAFTMRRLRKDERGVSVAESISASCHADERFRRRRPSPPAAPTSRARGPNPPRPFLPNGRPGWRRRGRRPSGRR